jgi:hypothetical protein
MNNYTLTKIQEVYFDLCDILEKNDYSKTKIKGFYEFDDLREFLTEQKNKLAEIETAIDLERVK